jgi:DNA polymerase-3 subunit alpha
LDGAIDIKRLVKRVKELGMDAVGLTDHGNMIKTYELQKECLAQGVKPIIGCEFYVGEPDTEDLFHLVLLAKDNTGLHNLYKLNAYAWKDNFYKKPRITYEQLVARHTGLICLTACLGSEFASDKDMMLYNIEKYHDLFGEGLYLEIQPNKIPEQKQYNNYLVDLSHRLDIPLVVTCDAHYLLKEDVEAHDTLLCMQTKKKKTDADRFRFTGDDFYIKDTREIISGLREHEISTADIEEAINNTHEIANKCNAQIETGLNLTPSIGVADEYLELCRHCNSGWRLRFETGQIDGTKEEAERIYYELSVIQEKGYSGYFLIVEDFISWARNKGIYVGVGRGSAAGSMVAYLLGITNINPMKYGLLFERFLNPERNSAPDVDSDFDYERREEVIEYVKQKYGSDKVAHIIAEGTLACKAVVRKVLSVYDYDMQYINKICKTIPDDLGINLIDAYNKSDEFHSYMAQHNDLFQQMLTLEGLMSHVSKHAAGIVICSKPIADVVPCMTDSEDRSMYVTQWHKKILEDVGVYKFDFLGLKTLTLIRKTIENIKLYRNIEVNIDDIPLDDTGIYSVLNSGDLSGVFQFDAPAGRQTIGKIKPTEFNDIVAAEALCRPGVKEAELYITNKIAGFTGDLAELKETYGAIVYQEQTMLLMNRMTGGRWTLGKADKMRKVKNLEEYREDFVQCCADNNVCSDVANAVFSRFDLGYSFNKSHAACYAVVSAQTAWLKAHYRPEFMAALLTMDLYEADSLRSQYVMECRKYGIDVLPPDINKSGLEFTIEDSKIRFPLNSVAGVGDKVVQKILSERNNGSFGNIELFVERIPKKDANKKTITSLIKAGAFDYFAPNRHWIIERFFMTRNEPVPQLMTWEKVWRNVYELEMLGCFVTKHPLSDLNQRNFAAYQQGDNVIMTGSIAEKKQIKDKNNNNMCFMTLETLTEKIDCVIFSRTFANLPDLTVGGFYKITGRKDNNSIIVEEMKPVNVMG